MEQLSGKAIRVSIGEGLGFVCKSCSPDYQQMLNEPEAFLNREGEQMTVEEVRHTVDLHLSQGGKITDKVVL